MFSFLLRQSVAAVGVALIHIKDVGACIQIKFSSMTFLARNALETLEQIVNC